MGKKTKLNGFARGLTTLSASFLSLVFIGSTIAEANVTYVDEFLGTKSQTIVTEEVEGQDLYTFKSDYKTAKEMVEANVAFDIKAAANGMVLMKNNGALPLKSNEKAVTLVGKAAYSNVLGGQMGSGATNNAKYAGYEQNTLIDALTENGFTVNERMTEAYKVDYNSKNGTYGYRQVTSLGGSFGMTDKANWEAKGWAFDINEVKMSELEAKDEGVTTAGFGDYKTGIVVLGRKNSEGRDYIPGEQGVNTKDGKNAGAKDPLGLSDDERAMIAMAKEYSDKVIVLVNSNSPMELAEVANDPGVDAILWIGTPGTYGMDAVAQILEGKVNPSGRLPDTYAYDNSMSPAAQNWDIFTYTNLDEIATKESDNLSFKKGENGEIISTAVSAENLRASAYTVYAEGIYVGYKYYESRYYDSVANPTSNAKDALGAKEGATAWNYEDEVLYTFGYGLSYTTFEQTLKSVKVDKAAKTVTAVINVENTGNVDGKEAVQLYASVPYTAYDKANLIEKSAIQLLDYTKVELKAGANKDVTITADLSDLASYDSKVEKTYILEEGDYYFSIGNAHEALNNILAKQGFTTANGMDANGDANNVQVWKHGEFDATTFSVSDHGVKITNQLDNADLNYYQENAVTYLSRNNYKTTFPKTYGSVTANEEMIAQLRNYLHKVSTDDVVTTKWGVDKGEEALTLAAMKGVPFDDIRWDSFVEQITLHNAIHIIAVGGNSTWVLEEIQNPFAKQADGPNGYNSFGLGAQVMDENSPYKVAEDDPLYKYGFGTAPNAPLLAASFDKEILAEYGKIIGNQSLWTGGPSIWAGGANQHRAPYEGRTHEYFSEDPILSAYSLYEMTSNALDYGCLIGPKHFAFNAIEYNRYGLSEFMTEQCAREGELRCFQKAFESGECLATMTAFNRIGCSNLNGHIGLMQNILRKEWGFKGLATTDMVNGQCYFLPGEAILGGLTMMANGRGADADLKPEWVMYEEENIKNDAKLNAALAENMHYQWYAYAQSNAMNGLNASSKVVQNMTWWRQAIIGAEVAFAALTLLGAVMYVVSVKSEEK